MENMPKSGNPGFRSSLVMGMCMYLHIYLLITKKLDLKSEFN